MASGRRQAGRQAPSEHFPSGQRLREHLILCPVLEAAQFWARRFTVGSSVAAADRTCPTASSGRYESSRLLPTVGLGQPPPEYLERVDAQRILGVPGTSP